MEGLKTKNCFIFFPTLHAKTPTPLTSIWTKRSKRCRRRASAGVWALCGWTWGGYCNVHGEVAATEAASRVSITLGRLGHVVGISPNLFGLDKMDYLFLVKPKLAYYNINIQYFNNNNNNKVCMNV
ncbi:hypothetical protein ERO13_D05G099666v2 [Gossypium hirsutum]|nr:hypothetical protein ERO13_D05G099666v2 [Gossypium hirsutum]